MTPPAASNVPQACKAEHSHFDVPVFVSMRQQHLSLCITSVSSTLHLNLLIADDHPYPELSDDTLSQTSYQDLSVSYHHHTNIPVSPVGRGITYKNIFPVLRGQILIRRLSYSSKQQLASVVSCVELWKRRMSRTDSIIKRILLHTKHVEKQLRTAPSSVFAYSSSFVRG